MHNGFHGIIKGMKENIIYVTGFIGARRQDLARDLAAERGWPVLDLDQEILRRDGRSVRRIAMTMGEHEVRNKEYEALAELEPGDGLVVVLSDGVLLDDQCRALAEKGEIAVADGNLAPEILWAQALEDPDPPYAFLRWEDRDAGFRRFLELYGLRMPMYRRYMNEG